MIASKRWSVDLFIGERDGRTHAEARLITEGGGHLVGTGEARLNPSDQDVPVIGDELAVARALSDLGHQLLATASADIEARSHRPVYLSG
ncbi:DUF1876 domain-containing protein [Dactylosporangium sp. NPDC051485]|uniref:DUF1876 domain-containing protein n=1 Tax=Dactylosporangium sp. NPDC051485 TaxID=3154846 RepID=UPI0034291519